MIRFYLKEAPLIHFQPSTNVVFERGTHGRVVALPAFDSFEGGMFGEAWHERVIKHPFRDAGGNPIIWSLQEFLNASRLGEYLIDIRGIALGFGGNPPLKGL